MSSRSIVDPATKPVKNHCCRVIEQSHQSYIRFCNVQFPNPTLYIPKHFHLFFFSQIFCHTTGSPSPAHTAKSTSRATSQITPAQSSVRCGMGPIVQTSAVKAPRLVLKPAPTNLHLKTTQGKKQSRKHFAITAQAYLDVIWPNAQPVLNDRGSHTMKV